MKAIATSLATVAAVLIAGAAAAQEKIAVLVPALLDPGAPIGEAVKRECNVETNVGRQVLERVSQRFPGTPQIENEKQAAPNTPVLRLTLTSVLGAGGGSWSGNKSMTVRAEVLQGSNVEMANTFTRSSGGGMMGGLTGTCAIMDRIAVALGQDVARWLPSALVMIQMQPSSKPAGAAEVSAPSGAQKDEPKKEEAKQ